MKKSLLLGVLITLAGTTNANEGIAAQDAARLMAQVRDRCAPYITNGVRYWRGDYKKATDAPGLVLLNQDIQHSVRGADSANAAGEIAWQKCLDFVFNNQQSKDYLK